MIDQDMNTDEVDFDDEWQNTSRVYVEYESEPEMKDESLQWDEEKVEEIHQGIQYTLESEVIECQDASIQYSLEIEEEK
jgi:hypothetical protein